MGRAGKVGGKDEHWFNLQDNNSLAAYVEDRRKMNDLKVLYHNTHLVTATEIYMTEDVFAGAKELENWKSNQVFEEVQRQEAETRVLETTWVCNIKDDKHKAWLVVRRYQEDTSKISTESPTCNKETVRILMVIATTKSWRLQSLYIYMSKRHFYRGQSLLEKCISHLLKKLTFHMTRYEDYYDVFMVWLTQVLRGTSLSKLYS